MGHFAMVRARPTLPIPQRRSPRGTRLTKTSTSSPASLDTSGQITRLAKRKHLDVMQGIYLRRIKTPSDKKANDAEIDLAVQLAQQGLVDSIIVGNESLGLSGQPNTEAILT